MRKILHRLCLFFVFIAICSCSNSNSDEKSTIEKHNDKVAEEAVRAIQTPIDRAQSAVDAINAQAKETSEKLNQE